MTVDPTLFAGAAVLVIAGLGAAIVQIINAWGAAKERILAAAERKVLLDKTDAAAEQARVRDAKLDSLKATAEESAKNVDGNLTKVRDQLTEQTAHSKALQQTVDTLAQILKSQRSEIAAIDHAVNGEHGTPLASESLDHIETNTKETAKNTAKTTADVQELKDKP